MKQNFTTLLRLSIIFAIIIFILCYCAVIFEYSITSFELTKAITSKVEIGEPGTGEYLILFGSIAILSDFIMIIVQLGAILLLPSFILCVIFISQAIARLFQIGEEKKWKKIISLIFTYISIILQIGLFLEFIFVIIAQIYLFKKISIFIATATITEIIYIILFIRELIKIKQIKKTKSIIIE